MITAPDLTWRRRILWGFAGVLWFFWIAYEDQGLIAVTIVAVTISAAASITLFERSTQNQTMPRRAWLAKTGFAGFVAGLAVGPISALLMLIKLGLHAHGEPDFAPDDFALALMRSIGWALLGAGLGILLGFLRRE